MLMLLIPLLAGLFVAPASPVAGDELSDALGRQKALEARIKAQKEAAAELTAAQHDLRGDIQATTATLGGINADLKAVRKKVNGMVARIEVVKTTYEGLVIELGALDTEVKRIEAEEATKKSELGERKQLLAKRIRAAYDTNRTSMLETFLSGESFADILSEMSYYIDVGEQDRALAQQIVKDRETLAAIHATVELTRDQTNLLRQETAAQKKELDLQLEELKLAQAQLKKLEAETKKVLTLQKKAYAQLARNKAALQRAIKNASAAKARLQRQIDRLIDQQFSRGNIPSQFNGTMEWPMVGQVSGEFGCSSYPGYAPGYGCEHFHNGIDIVNDCGTAIRAAAVGRVAYVGWNFGDGYDPAWIVVVAHAENLQTWYAHMKPLAPNGVRQGAAVKAGQILGYEGNTGNSTGCHLHWMVEMNGTFRNPREFV
jgi:murein DD-endopeptidase MepM/ murein hydrolase activator NlpD